MIVMEVVEWDYLLYFHTDKELKKNKKTKILTLLIIPFGIQNLRETIKWTPTLQNIDTCNTSFV